ncbi:hypothetical protein F5B20DRAFT_540937 [Whalleya microplaca]|nr:hypothetical protein F5B20DRAFT_540937 [Whalleya microplaca]
MPSIKSTCSSLFSLLAFVPSTIQGPVALNSGYPTTTRAGVEVVDTPIVQSAYDFSRLHLNDFTFKHSVRAWLYGALMIQHNTNFSSRVDLEIHAVSTLLHDLGWDSTPNSTLISPDRRFEVDGAVASRDFIRTHQDGQYWDENRVQLVWDAIALHTTRNIAYYKQIEVEVVSRSIALDFDGPGTTGITDEEYDAVTAEYPKDDLKAGTNSTLIWLCETKPATTYDNWVQSWGQYVENYTLDGNSRFYTIFKYL